MNKEHKTKKERVIEAKLKNPDVSLKIIAENEKVSYGYARKEWAKYKRNLVTNKGSPIPSLPEHFPFHIQRFGFNVDGPGYWYRDCPADVSVNRNGQKVFGCPYFSFVVHKSGSVQVYNFSLDWEKRLRAWLSGWMSLEDIGVFFDYLVDRDQRHYCVDAPGVPTGYKFTIPDIGTFSTDRTPFKRGTMEFEVNPGFPKRLRSIESSLITLSQNQASISQNMEAFGKGMEEHMKLIAALNDVANSMRETLEEMRKPKPSLFSRFKNWVRSLFR